MKRAGKDHSPGWIAGHYPSEVFAKKRAFALIVMVGIILLICGTYLILKMRTVANARIAKEDELRAVYHSDVDREAESKKAIVTMSTQITNPIEKSLPTQSTLPRLRTFVTPKPSSIYVAGPQFSSLRRINRDIVGWLAIGEIIDHPVLQRDNSFYLSHDFSGEKSKSGALFLDQRFSLLPPNENLLIHGHNMRDGSMFGRLHKFRERRFYLDHWLIKFDTLYEAGRFAVFAAFDMINDVSEPSYFSYVYPTFETDEQFNKYITSVKDHSVFKCDLDILPTDALLTLSTCSGDNKYFVVFARRIRDDEDLLIVSTSCKQTSFR